MKYKKFIEKFKKQVHKLSYEKQLSFAIVICKNLYPQYQNFYLTHQWGDPDMLIDATLLLEQAQKSSIAKSEIEVMRSKVYGVTPDMDDFGDDVGTYALYAASAVYFALQFLLTKNPMDIFHVGDSFYNVVDCKVQEDDDLNERQIEKHPLVRGAQLYLLELTR